jgi:hypothetical protein
MENAQNPKDKREHEFQGRWYTWNSPVGLGLFILFCGITVVLLLEGIYA